MKYGVFYFCFFFFKQKTAYEIGVRLVGSEMCIRDSRSTWSGRRLSNLFVKDGLRRLWICRYYDSHDCILCAVLGPLPCCQVAQQHYGHPHARGNDLGSLAPSSVQLLTAYHATISL